jgi:hypothetical protein
MTNKTEKSKKTPSQRGKASRVKGRKFEQDVANIFREWFPDLEIYRGDQKHKARESDISGVPGFWIECQHAAKPNPKMKMEQARRDAGEAISQGTIPLVVYKKTGTGTVRAALKLSHLMTLTGASQLNYSENGNALVEMDLSDLSLDIKYYVNHLVE